jgi:dephospho-CoA kinase
LEALLHPLILEEVKVQIQLSQNKPYNIVVVPLLFTSLEFKKLVGRVLVVDCAEDAQVMRVKARSQMTEMEIHQIISQQTPRIQRLKQADDVLNNDTSLKDLTKQVNILHKMYSTLQNNN